jgi:putative Ca2+/H+ antiporter (TMEM165/GDT1 family)
MFSLSLMISTFCIVFVAELPDKTALAALILSTKYRARDVIIGAWLAFLVQTIVAVVAGGFLTLLPAEPIRIASGLGFLAFAALALKRNEKADEKEEAATVEQADSTRPVWLISFLVIFAAEWGDLTQLATAAIVARNGQPLSVGIGAVLALWAVTVVAAYSGSRLGKALKPRLLNMISAALFAAIGLFIVYKALV